MSTVLRVENVVQEFRTGFWMRRTRVLHEVSLEVPERSIFGFIGANGAGKTTLIQLIVGLRRPTGGAVTIDGLAAHTPEARARIGYLPERPYFHEHLTGEGLLRYFGALAGMSRARVEERIAPVLEAVGMSHARRLELRNFSKGMLQRIGIAQAILHDPRFLVLDEPMSGLDPLGRKEMRELIQGLAAEGRTVFFTSHVIPDVESLCDQVALIRKGRMVGAGPISKFLPGEGSRTEIVFSGLGIEEAGAIPGLAELRSLPDGVRAVADGNDAVNAAIAGILERRGRVHWVNPIRPSLEEQFEEAYR
jgi:ABC-2 type transport system ATP-binding protein